MTKSTKTSVYVIADDPAEAAEAAEKIVRHNDDWTVVNPWQGHGDGTRDELERRLWWLTRVSHYAVVGDPDREWSNFEIAAVDLMGLMSVDLEGLKDAHEEKERLDCE